MREKIAFVIAVVALLPACQSTNTGPDVKPSAQVAPVAVTSAALQSSARPTPVAGCPLLVAGTKVEEQDTPNGAALVFRTTGEVNAVRDHVRQMADFHNRMVAGGGPPMMGHGARSNADAGPPGMGMGRGHMMGGPGMGRAMGGRGMVASSAQVENTDDGARLVLVPNSPSDIATLRERARWRAERMATGPCADMGPGLEPDAGG